MSSRPAPDIESSPSNSPPRSAEEGRHLKGEKKREEREGEEEKKKRRTTEKTKKKVSWARLAVCREKGDSTKNGAAPLLGLCWRSTIYAQRRNELLSLPEGFDLFLILSHGCAADEKEWEQDEGVEHSG